MFPLLPNTNKKQASFETCVQNKHIMDQNITVPRIHAFSSPPSPPLSSCIIALSIATLIFMFFYVFSPIFSAAILLALCIIALLFCTFTQDQTFAFHAHTTPPKNQRLVKIFNNLFWVVEEKRSGKTQQVMKLLGSIVCFQNQPFLSGSECAICLEELKNGEECVVFSVCGHIFHFDCIKHWLEEKPTCPNCRHCVASSATMMKTTSMEFLENLVE
ncbi:RING-H2 finger protein ATL14-like [Vigna radiata var. radiata]|uniref:RING-H2 finger protein ATL14-like n=1 Tax=Vigna radiata var. radiata TaxID=3916 RepID=A0A3Q0EMW5_VIGRR|nr:RING-H2 finger protein ATL14-like [Vigna radiata var. radiata]